MHHWLQRFPRYGVRNHPSIGDLELAAAKT